MYSEVALSFDIFVKISIAPVVKNERASRSRLNKNAFKHLFLECKKLVSTTDSSPIYFKKIVCI